MGDDCFALDDLRPVDPCVNGLPGVEFCRGWYAAREECRQRYVEIINSIELLRKQYIGMLDDAGPTAFTPLVSAVYDLDGILATARNASAKK
jgi:hypothetical protein